MTSQISFLVLHELSPLVITRQTGHKKKLNTFISFPEQLDMGPFLEGKQGISKKNLWLSHSASAQQTNHAPHISFRSLWTSKPLLKCLSEKVSHCRMWDFFCSRINELVSSWVLWLFLFWHEPTQLLMCVCNYLSPDKSKHFLNLRNSFSSLPQKVCGHLYLWILLKAQSETMLFLKCHTFAKK